MSKLIIVDIYNRDNIGDKERLKLDIFSDEDYSKVPTKKDLYNMLFYKQFDTFISAIDEEYEWEENEELLDWALKKWRADTSIAIKVKDIAFIEEHEYGVKVRTVEWKAGDKKSIFVDKYYLENITYTVLDGEKYQQISDYELIFERPNTKFDKHISEEIKQFIGEKTVRRLLKYLNELEKLKRKRKRLKRLINDIYDEY